MSENPNCPKCQSTHAYPDGDQLVCPECFHEWRPGGGAEAEPEGSAAPVFVVKDANGQVLQSGDSVVVLKDLKVKGASSSVKGGTKVRNIRVLDESQIVDGHNISCKIDGIGALNLKSEFVKKA